MTHVTTVVHAEAFEAPASSLWALLVDWGAIGEWMPGGFIRSVTVEGQGVGAVRHLVTGRGVSISERLDAADEAMGVLELSLVGTLPWNLQSYRARGEVVALGPRRCRLTWCGTFATAASGAQADYAAHVLKKSYESMFSGIRGQTTLRA